MKVAKAIAVVTLVALGAALTKNAGAQQPTPLPHVQIGMPVTPPPGWDTKMWANLRAHCQGIADRAAAGMPYSRWQDMEDGKSVCMTGIPIPTSAEHQPPQPQPTFGGGPRPTPVPPVGKQSSALYGKFSERSFLAALYQGALT
jgi:hypothetical protein